MFYTLNMPNRYESQTQPSGSEKHLFKDMVSLAVIIGAASIGLKMIRELGNDWDQGATQQIGVHTKKITTSSNIDIFRAANDI